MTETDRAMRDFLNAAAMLLQAVAVETRDEDADTAAALQKALLGGALAELRATLAPSTGCAWVRVDMATPAGEVVPLLAAELQRQVQQ